MAVTLLKERWQSQVGEVVLGATSEQGGTRSHTITIGGDSTLPYLQFEGVVKNRPVIALEVQDVEPDWNEGTKAYYAGVLNDPAAWAKKCVEYGADLIYLKLNGANPEGANKSPEECAKVVKDVLAAVSVPLIVVGCDDEEKDNEILAAVAEAAAGENLLIGCAEQENYKSLAAACMVHKHTIIARSPLDINICKQLNILINEMGLPLNKIVIDPTLSGLGFGVEYGYSIMERARMGSIMNDKMLAMPIICAIGYECGRAKEANATEEEQPSWGNLKDRQTLWETMTASAFLQAGGNLFVVRSPESLKLIKKNIDELMVSNA